MAADKQFGRYFEEYALTYRQIRKLGEGGYGEVFLVQRISDQKYFAAKHSLDQSKFVSTLTDFEMLVNLKSDFIVQFVECYHSIKERKMIIILEYCSCKLSDYCCLFICIDGDLNSQIRFWKK